jgi:hypothetical protein
MTRSPAAPSTVPSLASTATAALAAALLALLGPGCGSDLIKQGKPFHAPCTEASECGTQPTFSCEATASGNFCRKDCRTDFDCGTLGVCVMPDAASGRCYQSCESGAACAFAPGYSCKPASGKAASHAYCDVGQATAPDAGGASSDLRVADAGLGG